MCCLLCSDQVVQVLRTRGIRYVTVSDFVTVSGPYAAAFYPEIGPDNKDVKPWIVLVFKMSLSACPELLVS